MTDFATSVMNVTTHQNVLFHWQIITLVLIKVFFTNVVNVTTSVATGQSLRSTI